MTNETRLENDRTLNSKKISYDIDLRKRRFLLFFLCLVVAVHAQEKNPFLSKEELMNIASQMKKMKETLLILRLIQRYGWKKD